MSANFLALHKIVFAILVLQFSIFSSAFSQDSAQETEIIQEIEKPLETEIIQEAEEIAEFYSKSIEEKLRHYTFQDEQLFLSQYNGNPVYSSQIGNGKTALYFRKFYDEKMRLVKKETWKIGATAKKSAVTAIKNYFYSGENFAPAKSEEYVLHDGKRNVFSDIEAQDYKTLKTEIYDDSGRITEESLVAFEAESEISDSKKNDSKKSESEKEPAPKRIIRKTQYQKFWTYDKSNRIASEEEIKYKYSENLKKKPVEEKSSSKTVFLYTGIGPQPDSKYYENGILRIETRYFDKKDYSQKMYFPGNITVELLFADGLKKREIVMSEGRQISRREF